MTTVGIFAGRGDVILAMTMAAVFGFWFGYKVCGWVNRIRQKRLNRME